MALIAFGLRKHGTDPTLPAAILALYDLGTALIEDAKAPETALRIFQCIAEVAPDLKCLSNDESAAAKVGYEVERAAPKIDAAQPAGSLKVASFHDPGTGRP